MQKKDRKKYFSNIGSFHYQLLALVLLITCPLGAYMAFYRELWILTGLSLLGIMAGMVLILKKA